MGTPDANGKAPRFTGVARLTVTAGDPDTDTDEADVQLEVSLSDVRDASGLCRLHR